MFRKLHLLLFFTLFVTISQAQQSLDLDFNGSAFLDNREYKAFTPRSHTYFGTRAALDVGLNIDSMNSFRVGINGIHELGAKPYFLRVDPVIYYQYQNKGWQFNVGAFPRKNLLTSYPISLLNDTLNYFRPNVEGMLVRYANANFRQTVWIDWVSRQTAFDRENFLFGTFGEFKPNAEGAFFISHYFMLLHDAGAGIAVPNDNIRDNGGAQLRIGLDLSNKTALDSLTIDAGGMLSLERVRGIGGFNIPKGFVANLHMGWKKFEINDSFYAGEGHHIAYGDAYYTKKLYNRIDVSWAPFVFNHIQGKFVFSFHQSPGKLADNQQAFFLTYDLGRKKLLKFKE
ncbi:MAG: hypothetical protein ACOH2A_13430 [Sphingobacteriaceae bacterium]